MANSIADKLKLKQGYSLLTIHAPDNFKKGLGKIPAGVKISDNKTTAETQIKKVEDTTLYWIIAVLAIALLSILLS